MLKRKSIFWTTILILLPLVLLSDVVVLFGAHSHVQESTKQHFISDIENAAAVANELLYDCNLKDPKHGEYDSKGLSELCKHLELPYIYVIEIDEQKSTIKYLCIGLGKGASEDFIKNRHVGDVVPVEMNQYFLNALQGKDDNNIERVQNQFDDTMTCYIKRTGKNAKNEVVAAEISVASVIAELDRSFNFIAFITILFTIVFVLFFALIIHRRVQKPARLLSKKMTGFVHDRQKGFEKLEINSSREFSDMASSFNSMAEEIDRYLNEITELNRQKAELHIARQIQEGLLEPAESDSPTASINACMLPARDVGGDLYDYIKLDNGNICVVIADVSGKGVSAALFMSKAITLLHQYAESGMSPGKILYEYNNHLADHNPNMLFITTFVAIYDPETNELTYANAGHNTPYILSGGLIKLDGEFGMAAGVFRDEKYVEHTVKLKEGDILFLYTDGVTEAKNSDGALFSDSALEKTLTSLAADSVQEPIPAVLQELQAFTDGADQTDDITMLTLRIPPHTCQKLRLEAKTENLKAIFNAIAPLDIPDEAKLRLRFMAEEMFVNICSYAYPDSTGTAEVIIETGESSAVLIFIDNGLPFDPTQNMMKPEEYDIDRKVGGLGRFLTFRFADSYSYRRGADKNVLTIIKNL